MHDGVHRHDRRRHQGEQARPLAVTGDLVNLALDGEIEMARLWLETLGSAAMTCRSFPAITMPMCRAPSTRSAGPGRAWMTGDGARRTGRPQRFSLSARARQRRADRRLDRARHRPVHGQRLLSRRIRPKRLGTILDATARRGLFRVVMIHHPPVRDAVSQYKRLFGIAQFPQDRSPARRRACPAWPFAHAVAFLDRRRRGHQIPVVGVAAAGQALGGLRPPAQYNLLDIGGEKGNWRIAADAARADRDWQCRLPTCRRWSLARMPKHPAQWLEADLHRHDDDPRTARPTRPARPERRR